MRWQVKMPPVIVVEPAARRFVWLLLVELTAASPSLVLFSASE